MQGRRSHRAECIAEGGNACVLGLLRAQAVSSTCAHGIRAALDSPPTCSTHSTSCRGRTNHNTQHTRTPGKESLTTDGPAAVSTAFVSGLLRTSRTAAVSPSPSINSPLDVYYPSQSFSHQWAATLNQRYFPDTSHANMPTFRNPRIIRCFPHAETPEHRIASCAWKCIEEHSLRAIITRRP